MTKVNFEDMDYMFDELLRIAKENPSKFRQMRAVYLTREIRKMIWHLRFGKELDANI